MNTRNGAYLSGECADEPATPILSEAEADRRVLLLTELQARLGEIGVRCVLARTHRLVLRYNHAGCGPSGLTDPALHMFPASGAARSATTDGSAYRLDNGEEFPASDPAAAAALIGDTLRATVPSRTPVPNSRPARSPLPHGHTSAPAGLPLAGPERSRQADLNPGRMGRTRPYALDQ